MSWRFKRIRTHMWPPSAGVRKKRWEEFVALHTPGAKAYGEYEAMLDDQSVDIVSECMPNHLHSKEGVLALDAGNT